MAFRVIIKKPAFWKSVMWMGISFIIIYNLITILFHSGRFEFDSFYAEKLSDGKWLRFILVSLASGFIYGFIISYGLFLSKVKKEKENG